MALDGGLVLKRCATAISQRLSSFHQHLLDVTPLLEQELVLHPDGVIMECNHVGESGNSRANPA
jgi:hypothetical protein